MSNTEWIVDFLRAISHLEVETQIDHINARIKPLSIADQRAFLDHPTTLSWVRVFITNVHLSRRFVSGKTDHKPWPGDLGEIYKG